MSLNPVLTLGLAIFVALSCGCSHHSEPNAKGTKLAGEPRLTEITAKEALLARMRSENFFHCDAKEWADDPMQQGEDGWFDFGAIFRVNPGKKIYTVTIGPPPDVKACTFTWEGAFVFEGDRWVAAQPKGISAALGGGR